MQIFSKDHRHAWLYKTTKTCTCTPHLDLNEINRLHEPRSCSQHTGIEHTTCCRDDLATPPVDSVSMEGDIMDVEPYSSQVLLTQHSLMKK